MSDFDSAWRKWRRAMTHAEALEADIARFADDLDSQPVLRARTEYQSHRHAVVVLIDSVSPLPAPWGLILGDVASNYRAALDHFAWALVERGSRPPGVLTEQQQRSIYFPITISPDEFRRKVSTMLPGVRRADLAIVRRYQPYLRGKSRVRHHALSMLGWLNNFDKHRTIQPMWSVPVGGEYRIVRTKDCDVTATRLRMRALPLEVGAEVQVFRVRRTGPQPDVQVEINLSTQVSLDNRVPVIDWLDKTEHLIATMLWEVAAPPDDIAERAARWRHVRGV